MKKSDFLVELEDILQREDDCKETDNLIDYDEWDSLSKMSIMAYYDKTFGIKLSLNDLKTVSTVSELIKLAGDNIED